MGSEYFPLKLQTATEETEMRVNCLRLGALYCLSALNLKPDPFDLSKALRKAPFPLTK